MSQIEPKLTLLNFVQSFHPRKLQRIEYVVSAGKLLIMSKQTVSPVDKIWIIEHQDYDPMSVHGGAMV